MTVPLHNNAMFIEKYRPKSLADLLSHQDIVSTLQTLLDKNNLPHLLLYGPAGTGKTSTIHAIARSVYGEEYKKHILELNASDDRGIDTVREEIKTFASTQSLHQRESSGFKIVILDEADNMTQAAQNALRRVVEKYSKNVRFCIVCNYVNKIIPALQSRFGYADCTDVLDSVLLRFRGKTFNQDYLKSAKRKVLK